MHIFIPSYDRADMVTTTNQIPISYRKKTFIVVRKDQKRAYTKANPGWTILACPEKGIAKTRQWIIDNSADRYAMMIDDDMQFGMRKDGKLPNCIKSDMKSMFQLLESWLEAGIVHVGVSQRFGNNRVETSCIDITRMNNVYAYDTHVMRDLKKSHNIGFHWLEEQNPSATVMEDFAVTLNLFKLGYANRVTYDFCWSQKQSGMEGGCSSYRTYDAQKTSAFEIAKHFPNIAIPVEKEAKVEWKGIGFKRWDLRIMWKKAYEMRTSKSIRRFLGDF
jgi:hypothetical protein